MRIAILVMYFPPKWLAGTEIASYNIATKLANRGHEVHVITSLDDGLPFCQCMNSFTVHRVKRQKSKIGVLSFSIGALKIIKEIKPDIIQVQGLYVGITAYLSKIVFKIPYVIWGRGTDVNNPIAFSRKPIIIGLKNADVALALTEQMKWKMGQFYRREILVVPNGIDMGRFQNSQNSLAEISDIKNANTILYIGRLIPVKGVEYLIRSMKIIINDIPDTNLIIVGDGADRKKLENITHILGLEDHIKFIGQIPNCEIPKFTNIANIFVLSSINEGFPNVILEAMASGLPIVATKVGGLPDIVEENVNGYLVESKCPEKLAEKIVLILKNKKMQQEISTNNKKKASTYSWNNVINMLERIYTDTLTEYD